MTELLAAVANFGVWFWVIFFALNVLMLAWIEFEKTGWATFCTILAVLGMHFVLQLPILNLFLEQPGYALTLLGGYFAIGTFWAVIKWWLYVRNEREKYDEFKLVFCAQNNISGNTIPENLKQAFKTKLSDYNCSYNVGFNKQGIELRPQVTSHKESIYTWMAYWPWSFVWTIINDPIRKMFRYIYTKIRRTLQQISDSVWAGVDQDIK